MVRSEHGSPEPRAALFRENIGALPPLDLDYPRYTDPLSSDFPSDYIQSPQVYENFYTSHEDLPSMSAGLSNVVDWSDLNLPLDNSVYSAAYSQPASYSSYDHNPIAAAGLPTSSSCDISDAGDYISHITSTPQTSPFRPDLAATSSAEARSLHRLSTSSFTSVPQASALLSPNKQTPHSIENDYLPASIISPTRTSPPTPVHAEDLEKHGFTVHDAQKMAHPETPTEAMGDLSLPVVGEDIEEGSWATRRDSFTHGTFVNQQMIEGGWGR